ncbi:maleylpyruvate isomerase family mycothiol-dependent enzyme [Spirillospora sp. NPDC050679]
MAVSLRELIDDVGAETGDFRSVVSGLSAADWRRSIRPSWSVGDAVSRLVLVDEMAILALSDPSTFRAQVDQMIARVRGGADYDLAIEDVAGLHPGVRYRDLAPADLLDCFDSARSRMVRDLAASDPRARVPWAGPGMSVATLATARLMDTWVYGYEIGEAVQMRQVFTDRLRHTAHLGVRTFAFSYTVRGRPVPEEPVHVELTLPSGAVWTAGPDTASNTVHGTAADFCLVTTQRLRLQDTDLKVNGPTATEWLENAQAYTELTDPGGPQPDSGTNGVVSSWQN